MATLQANPNKMSTSEASATALKFKIPTKLRDDDFFYYGKGMQAKFISSER